MPNSRSIKNKSCALVITGLIQLLVTAGCSWLNSDRGPAGKDVSAETAKKMTIGLVLDRGGKDDRSFNAAAWEGAQRAAKEFGIEVKDVQAPDVAAFEPAIKRFAEKKFPLVISIGFLQADAVKKAAQSYPATHFAIVDAEVDLPNVASYMFAEHEGGFLMGTIAALATKSNKVGFIGGMEVPLIRRFLVGYEAGAKTVNPKIEVVSHFVGTNQTAWADPAKAKELALAQINQGVDCIFQAAGASGTGVFDAVAETGDNPDRSKKKPVYAIGVDSNQNWIKPGKVLTSMLKRVDLAVYNAIKQASQGRPDSGLKVFSLRDRGIDYAIDDNNREQIEPYHTQIEETRAKIVEGKIKVPDYYQQMKVTEQKPELKTESKN